MGNYKSSHTGKQIDSIIDLFLGKRLGPDTTTEPGFIGVNGVVQRNGETGEFSTAFIPQGTVESITAGAGLNTLSDDSGQDGGTITETGTLYLTKSGVTADEYGDNIDQFPDYGETFKVPFIEVDKYGRITQASAHDVAIPASDNTTYTFTTGSTNGTFKVTSSGGNEQSISIYGLTNTAYTPVASSITETETGIPNAGIIYNFVNTAIQALPEPMIFKGSLGEGGTITTLPTAAAQYEGFTYKVITAGTYAGQAAKIGDTFICANNNNIYEWVLIPSGDEPSGTVTSVSINGGNSISVSGSPITSSGTISLGLNLASNGARGGVQVGYTTDTTNKNYAVQLDNEKMYVNVPWENTTYTAGTGLSLTNNEFSVKLGYTTSGVNRAVQADANGNLYVTQSDLGTQRSIQVNDVEILGNNLTPLNLKAGDNVTLTTSGGSVTINASGSATSIPLASDTVRGGAKIGYTTDFTNQNYAVQLSNERMYVHVPWEETEYTAGTGISISQNNSISALANTVNQAGIVSAPTSANPNKIWGTDSNGNPDWTNRDSLTLEIDSTDEHQLNMVFINNPT